MSPTYEVELRADVMASVIVEAENEEAAEELAYAEVGDDFEVDFAVTGVWLREQDLPA